MKTVHSHIHLSITRYSFIQLTEAMWREQTGQSFDVAVRGYKVWSSRLRVRHSNHRATAPLLLPLYYCPSITVPLLLPLYYSPSITAPILLSLYYCPSITVHLLLPLYYCLSITAPLLLPLYYDITFLHSFNNICLQ